MKGLIAACIVAGLVFACSPAGAEADVWRGTSGIKVRDDGNDSTTPLDINQLATNRGARKTYFGVATYDPFTSSDLDAQSNNYFAFYLDTYARGSTDRIVYLYYWPPDGRYYCELDARGGNRLALRYARRPDINVIDCKVPTRKLAIEKTPSFSLNAYYGGSLVDRAPNFGSGRFRGL
jgi:hypothetical protein